MADEEQNLSAACTDLSSAEPITEARKHTPGPWQADWTNGAKETLVVVPIMAGNNGNWAVLGHCGGHDKEANARLIAAAPDTLAEFRALYRAYVNLLEIGRDRIIALGGDCDPVDRMEEGDPALIKARAAIAQATGGGS